MTFLMKIIFAGDGGVGKTSLRERYLGRGFQSKYMMTIGGDFVLKETVIDGRAIKYQIWDLAGQTRFGAVRSVYYLGALGALLLFDVTRRETFENLENWIKEIWNHNGRGVIPLVILGNKVDLRDQHPDSITDEMAQRYCDKLTDQTKSNGFEVHYLQTSAKTGLNVTEAMELLGRVYFQSLDKNKKTNEAIGLTIKPLSDEVIKKIISVIMGRNFPFLSQYLDPNTPLTNALIKEILELEPETLLNNLDKYQSIKLSLKNLELPPDGIRNIFDSFMDYLTEIIAYFQNLMVNEELVSLNGVNLFLDWLYLLIENLTLHIFLDPTSPEMRFNLEREVLNLFKVTNYYFTKQNPRYKLLFILFLIFESTTEGVKRILSENDQFPIYFNILNSEDYYYKILDTEEYLTVKIKDLVDAYVVDGDPQKFFELRNLVVNSTIPLKCSDLQFEVFIKLLKDVKFINDPENLTGKTWEEEVNRSKKYKIFISYSRKDTQILLQIKEFLDKNSITYWYDKNEIPQGANYKKEIVKGLEESEYYLLLLTNNSIRTDGSSDIISEFNIAYDNKMKILILCNDKSLIENNNKIPEEFRYNLQGRNSNKTFFEDDNIDPALEKILNTVQDQ